MNTRTIVIGIVACVLVGLGTWWLLRGQAPRGPEREAEPERLLIGFDPGNVSKVRLQVGSHTVEAVRRTGEWELSGAGAADSGLRVDVVLQRLAGLAGRRLAGSPAGARADRPTGAAAAELSVWRGSMSRPLVVTIYRRGSGLLIASSERPGRFEIDLAFLRFLETEVKPPQATFALPFAEEKLVAVEVRAGTRTVQLSRQGQAWSVAQAGIRFPAEADAVSALLRSLAGLQVTGTIDRGAAAVTRHGLDRPAVTLAVDDGQRREVRLGGDCPKEGGGRLAILGSAPTDVVCVALPEGAAWERPLARRGLFTVAGDEVRAVTVRRGSRTLAIVRPTDGGGWKLAGGDQAAVDQEACAAFVTAVARLAVAKDGEPAATEPPAARRAGEVTITPAVGSAERVELWEDAAGDALWGRPRGEGPFLPLGAEAVALLSADPVQLRSRTVCTIEDGQIQSVVKHAGGGATEVLVKDAEVWQIVLLEGHRAPEVALAVARTLERYEDRKDAQRPAYRRPVLLVGPPAADGLATLQHQLGHVQARRFVAAAAERSHGFTKAGAGVAAIYRHHCHGSGGSQTCEEARCAIEIGGAAPERRCYARKVGTPAVFEAERGLCEAVATPVVGRQVLDLALDRMTRIRLQGEGRTLVLERSASGIWGKAGEQLKDQSEAYAEALVGLGPLVADAVAGFAARGIGSERLAVRIQAEKHPDVLLRFHRPEADEVAKEWMHVRRDEQPLVYRVRLRLVESLLALLRRD